MLFDSQITVDIEPPENLQEVAMRVGHLQKFLKNPAISPGENFTGDLAVHKVRADGAVEFQLSGASMGAEASDGIQPTIRLTLPLGLKDSLSEFTIQDVFSAVPGTVIVDGGHVQNMLLTTLTLIAALTDKYREFDEDHLRISVVSSADPFRRLASPLAESFRVRVRVYPLGLPDRQVISLPYQREGRSGRMVIMSEPTLTLPALRVLLGENEQFARAFSSCTCFVSADPLFDLLRSHAVPPYAVVVRAVAAFRALVALEAYGTCALLPMIDGEILNVCRLMLSRASSSELDEVQLPIFPSPLSLMGDSIDTEALKTLDASLEMLMQLNPPLRNSNGLAFACPISFGHDGGLVVGVSHRLIACFSSIPSAEGERDLLAECGYSWSDSTHDVGAGDAVAAVISLFNAVSAEPLMISCLEGPDLANRDLQDLASVVFVSALGRLVGNLLIRTTKTDLSEINVEALSRLLDDAASESVALARRVLNLLPSPAYGVFKKWGIRFVVWVPRQVIFPSSV
jgi:hypothetical protein